MIKRLLLILCVIFALGAKTIAQCPQLYNYLGVLTATPLFQSCNGLAYPVNIQSNTGWGAYTINWGDATPNTTSTSYVANSIVTHTYAAATGSFALTLTIPSLNCTLTSNVVMEQAAVATISLNSIGATQCAPKTFTFVNITNNQTPSTTYTWSWGDGSPNQIFNASTNPSVITHVFQKNTVTNCQTTVFLYANNTCNFVPSFDQKGPFQIYDVDAAAVSPDQVTKCWPQNTFTFTNTTLRNCLPQGNTPQRYEYWNLGDHWGLGYDSIINWKPWPPTTPVAVSYPALGSYTVLLLDSNQCGIAAAVQTVNIVNPPNAGIVAPVGPFCQNTTITFTNTSDPGYSYSWNFGTGGGFSNLGNGNKSTSYTTPGTYTVKVIAFVNGSNSCRDTASAVVTIIAAPVSNFTYAPTSGCGSVTSTFIDGSTGAIAWNWTFGNGSTFNGQVPPTQSYTLPGVYTVSLVTTGSTTCVNTRTATVTVYAIPVPNFPTFANCVFASSNFTNTSTVTGTLAITNYTWNFGDGSPKSTSINPAHTYTAPNTYTVKLIAATPFCEDSISQTISINVKPTVNFVFTPTISCQPFVATFTNTTLNGINYLWRFGTTPNVTSTSTNPSFTYSNNTQSIANYTVALISSTGAGCADSLKKVIAVYPEPVASFTPIVNAGCSPIPMTFTNTTIGANTYTFDFGDGSPTFSISNLSNVIHTYTNTILSLQNRTVQLIVSNSAGCTNSITQIVQIFPEALLTFSMIPSSGCTPVDVDFFPPLGSISHTWNLANGNISNEQNPLTTYVNASTSNVIYTVSLIAANAFGCLDTAYGNVTVYPKPIPNFSLTPIYGCTPLQVNFNNTSAGGSTYLWMFGNGQSSTSSTTASATFTNAAGNGPNSYTNKLVVTTVNNCKDSVSKQVNLFAQPKCDFGSDTAACTPKLARFKNNSINVSGSNYNWNFGDGQTSLEEDPEHYYVNTTAFNQTYNIRLIGTSSDGCKDTLIKPIIIYPKPQFFISSFPDSGCTPLKVFFPKLVGVKLYSWAFGDGNKANAGDVSNLFVNNTPLDKQFDIQLIASDKYGCLDTAQKKVKVFPRPTASFNASPLSVFIPNEATKCYNFSLGASNYSWEFGDGNTSTEKDPSHTYTKKGEYAITLVATNVRGCVDTFALPSKVQALDETFVVLPNAFTPNPNGSPGRLYDSKSIENDIFHPMLRGAEKYSFSIYSRWGELLFDTKDPNEGWDGYYKTKLCTQDVYIWKVTATFVDGKTYNKTGDVLLLR